MTNSKHQITIQLKKVYPKQNTVMQMINVA